MSRPFCWAWSAVSATLREEKSPISEGLVDQTGTNAGGGRRAGAGVRVHPRLAETGEELLRRRVAAGQELTVGLGQRRDLVGGGEERPPMLLEDAAPRRGCHFGQFPQARAGAQAEPGGGDLDLGRASELDAP